MKHYDWYNISADGGETWTQQLLTKEEAEQIREEGYAVESMPPFTPFFGR